MNCLLSCEHVRRKSLYTLEAKTANRCQRGQRHVVEWMSGCGPKRPLSLRGLLTSAKRQ